MAYVRPLTMARQRGSGGIELTDSSDLPRRRRLSQPSTTSGAGPTTLANKDDPIIITSGSEDDLAPAIRPTQRRKSGSSRANRTWVPPSADAEVISLTDSEGENIGAGATHPTVLAKSGSTSLRPPRPSQGAPPSATAPAPAPAPTTAPVSAPESAPAPTSTQLPEQPPCRSSSSPSYGPPPDDLDDPFSNVDFDAGGDDVNPGQDWDGIDVGPSLATLPAAVSSERADAVETSVPESGGDGPTAESLFESYLNLDQLGGDVDQGMDDGVEPDGGEDREEERAVEDAALNGPETSTHDEDESSLRFRSADRDVRMQSIEEGEVDPNDVAPPRAAESLESGEIRSQELRAGGETWTVSEGRTDVDMHMRHSEAGDPDPNDAPALAARTTSQGTNMERPPSSTAPPRISVQPGVATLASMSTAGLAISNQSTTSASASLSPSSMSPRSTPSQQLSLTRMLVMPDISSYKGVRFKRSLAEARENSFFSRALNGAARRGKAPTSMGERSASGSVSTPVEAPSSVGEVPNQDVNADMQDGTLASMPPGVVSASSASRETQGKIYVRILAAAPRTTADDVPPPSTQPTPSSTQVTPSEPFPATQPPERSSSRPFIAPPRVPLPGTPMSLVDVFNDVRRKRLLQAEREQAQKRGTVDSTGTSTSRSCSCSFFFVAFSVR